MAFKNYNNNGSGNNNRPTNTTYSPISFGNPESKICQSRISIEYFNQLMRLCIALRNNGNSNDKYATYDNDNKISVYISFTKAKILHDMYFKEFLEKGRNNICIELKNGLLKISNGAEYGTTNPCISISYADEDGTVNEVIYETKSEPYSGAMDYKDGSYETYTAPGMELDTIVMALGEYYRNSSYAIAASVMEASMYKRNAMTDMIRSIADKVGVQTGGNKGNINNKTFLSGNGNGNSGGMSNYMNPPTGGGMNGTPKEYQESTFDDIAGSM